MYPSRSRPIHDQTSRAVRVFTYQISFAWLLLYPRWPDVFAKRFVFFNNHYHRKMISCANRTWSSWNDHVGPNVQVARLWEPNNVVFSSNLFSLNRSSQQQRRWKYTTTHATTKCKSQFCLCKIPSSHSFDLGGVAFVHITLTLLLKHPRLIWIARLDRSFCWKQMCFCLDDFCVIWTANNHLTPVHPKREGRLPIEIMWLPSAWQAQKSHGDQSHQLVARLSGWWLNHRSEKTCPSTNHSKHLGTQNMVQKPSNSFLFPFGGENRNNHLALLVLTMGHLALLLGKKRLNYGYNPFYNHNQPSNKGQYRGGPSTSKQLVTRHGFGM